MAPPLLHGVSEGQQAIPPHGARIKPNSLTQMSPERMSVLNLRYTQHLDALSRSVLFPFCLAIG